MRAHKNQAHSVQDVLQSATPSLLMRLPGSSFAVLADACVVALLALSIWLLVSAAEQPPILYLNFAIVGVRALALGRATFRYLERVFSHDAAFAQLPLLRTTMFDALLPRIPGGLGKKPRGQVLAAYVDDIDELPNEPLRVQAPAISGAIVTALTVLLIAVISPYAALITLLSMLTAGVLSYVVCARAIANSEAQLSGLRALLQDKLLERAESAAVLSVFGAADHANAEVLSVCAKIAAVQRRAAYANGLVAALFVLLSGSSSLAIIFAIQPQLGADITVALFALLVVVPAAVAEIAMQIPVALLARSRVLASAKTISELLQSPLPQEIVCADGAHDILVSNSAKPLELRDFSVSYPGSAAVLSGVSLEINRGEVVVLNGPSGAGKSTLAQALVRFLDYRGSYKIFGQEVNTLSLMAVRGVIGLCEQQPHIFNNTLRQNLLFARPGADDTELWRVLENVGLAKWALERGGLETLLGEAGALISGGQAQRIALARVLLADFPILVLDEPAAGVETALSDKLLRDMFAAIPKEKAVLLITHNRIPQGVNARVLHLPTLNRL